MYGTTFSRVAHVGIELVRRPRYAFPYVWDKVKRSSPLQQRLPWISYSCISYLDQIVHSGMRVFEYGSGGSSAYFLAKGCLLKCVENDPLWYSQVHREVCEKAGGREGCDVGRAEIVLIELPSMPDRDHPNVGRYISQVSTGGPWDIIFIDGVECEPPSLRVDCVRIAPDYLSAGGSIVLGDAYRKEYSEAVPSVVEIPQASRGE